MIQDTLTEEIKKALKEKDELRLSTLRLLSSALHNEEIAKQGELTEEEEIAVVRRQIKQREEATEAYEKGGRAESAEKEKKEAEILQEFLPTPGTGRYSQMSELEIERLVNQVIKETGAKEAQDFGRVMGVVMQKVSGRADGKTVAEVVRQRLK